MLYLCTMKRRGLQQAKMISSAGEILRVRRRAGFCPRTRFSGKQTLTPEGISGKADYLTTGSHASTVPLGKVTSNFESSVKRIMVPSFMMRQSVALLYGLPSWSMKLQRRR